MRSLLLLALASLSALAHAQGTSQTDVDKSALEPDRPLRLSVGTVNYKYQEPGYMKISGLMTQVAGEYRFVLPETRPMYLAIESSFTFSGSDKYDGSVHNLDTGVTSPKVDGSRDYILETRGLYDLTLLNGYTHQIEAYSGVGLWALYNRIGGEGSYGRQANYLYVPVGTGYSAHFNRTVIRLSGDYDFYVTGQTTSQMTDVGGSNDIVHQQGKGSGWRAKLEGIYKFNSFTLLTSIYYQAWSIANSNVTDINIRHANGTVTPGTIVEPANRTTMTGFTIGARF